MWVETRSYTLHSVVQNVANITQKSGRIMPSYLIVKSPGHASYRRPFVRTTDREVFTASSVSKAAAAPTAHFSLVSLVSCIIRPSSPVVVRCFPGSGSPLFPTLGAPCPLQREPLDLLTAAWDPSCSSRVLPAKRTDHCICSSLIMRDLRNAVLPRNSVEESAVIVHRVCCSRLHNVGLR